MKSLFIILCLVFYLPSKSQRVFPCQVLESVLDYEPAKRPFYFDKNASYPIVFYDTSGSFINCEMKSYYKREVKIVNGFPPKDFSIPSDYLITVLPAKNHYCKIIIYYKGSGAYCSFVLKRKKRGYKIISFRERYL